MAKSLGRGLASLIPDQKKVRRQTTPAVDVGISWLQQANREILEVLPEKIVANPYQPRKTFHDESLQDLVASIKEHGILQPLVVTKKGEGFYELVAGERRLRAATKLRLRSVPVIVRTAGELEKLELSLIENIQRQDLNPIERAEAYRKLVEEFSLTHEQTAKRMGKSRPVITNSLRLLELPAQVQMMISEGRLYESAALPLLELEDSKKQIDLANQISTEKLSKEESRRLVKNSKSKSESPVRQADRSLLAGLRRELETALQTKVLVSKYGQRGWQINISVYSLEELKAVIRKIVDDS